jgi:AraC-like DNA-binding protein
LLHLPAGSRAIAFHLVEFGHCEVWSGDGGRVLLTAGDMAICFGGMAHRLGVGRATQTQQIGELLKGKANRHRPEATGRPADTALTCGVFLLHHAEFNPLIEALPSVVSASLSRTGELHNFSGVARLLSQELDRATGSSSYVMERLLEVLCAEALRSHLEMSSRDTVGWFRSIKDPVVGRALSAIHAVPGQAWTVNQLADKVAMSPSRFAARFAESLGASPMAYVARWRMNIACRRLASTPDAIDKIAADVGYESPAAFNRAFKRFLGVPPATWRKQAAGR